MKDSNMTVGTVEAKKQLARVRRSGGQWLSGEILNWAGQCNGMVRIWRDGERASAIPNSEFDAYLEII